MTVAALEDNHVIGASMPISNDLRNRAAYEGQGVALAIGGLQRGEHYAVASYAPQPTPEELVRVKAVYPKALTRPKRELDVAPGVTALPFGTPGRDGTTLRLTHRTLQPYADSSSRAQAVAGDDEARPTRRRRARSLVQVDRRLHLFGAARRCSRTAAPRRLRAVTDAPGYCQHFSGAMALMFRYSGFRRASRRASYRRPLRRRSWWIVTDHDAHTWVEVWFRGCGWLPFDPTPAAAGLPGRYSSTSLGFNAQSAQKLLALVVRGGAVFGRGSTSGVLAHDSDRRTPRSTGDLPLGIGSPVTPEPKKRSPSLLFFLFLLASGLAAVIVS